MPARLARTCHSHAHDQRVGMSANYLLVPALAAVGRQEGLRITAVGVARYSLPIRIAPVDLEAVVSFQQAAEASAPGIADHPTPVSQAYNQTSETKQGEYPGAATIARVLCTI